jgi:membrane-bound acyltransferase YfiQ involved in biofilm formation
LEEHNKVSEDEPKTLLDLLGLFSMYEFIKTMRRVFDATAGLGFLVWTLLIEGTGFTAFFSTATADERSVLRLAAITYWVLVIGWLGVFLRLLCSSSYLDTLPLLRFFVLFLLGVFTIAWTLLLITSMNAGSFVNLIPVVLTLLLLLGTLPPGRHLS